MESIFFIFFVVLFTAITYKMAEKRGRNVWGYMALSLVISPLLAWIILLIIGDLEVAEPVVAEPVVAEPVEALEEV
jgi:hypothetical protein